MLKMRIFYGKLCVFVLRPRTPVGIKRLEADSADPSVGIPAYYYNFV